MEEWKNIKDFEDKYEVSDLGNVRNKKTKRILKPSVHRCGYLWVNLYKYGKRKNLYIHRLVADAFIQNPEMFTDIDHVDCDKTNNKKENLEWVSHKENVKRAIENGLFYFSEETQFKSGKEHPNYKDGSRCKKKKHQRKCKFQMVQLEKLF